MSRFPNNYMEFREKSSNTKNKSSESYIIIMLTLFSELIAISLECV